MIGSRLKQRVRFDRVAPNAMRDVYGVKKRDWLEHFTCGGDFKYEGGTESVVAGAITGTASFKIKVRSCAQTRSITTDDRVVDTRRGISFNITEVDMVSDPLWVWIVVKDGVAI